MRNPKLDEAIEAAARVTEPGAEGPLNVAGVAYRLGMSVPNLYRLKSIGRLWNVDHALRLKALAAEGGYAVTIEELAGRVLPNGKAPKPTTSAKGPVRGGGRSAPSSSPVAAVPATQASIAIAVESPDVPNVANWR